MGGNPGECTSTEEGKLVQDSDGNWICEPIVDENEGEDKGTEEEVTTDEDEVIIVDEDTPLGGTTVPDEPKQTLPKTGEQINYLARLFGVLLILSGVALGWRTRRSNNK